MTATISTAPLILASASPRRKALLSLLVQDFQVRAADVDENPLQGEKPRDLAARLAQSKAVVVYAQAGRNCRVLGGDTVVAVENVALGKPKDAAEARGMLAMLSGRSHQVFSAVAICDESGIRHQISETTVVFRELTAETIEEYCASTDPYDKAGGYGIQGEAGSFVVRLDGSYSGVVGLPLWHTQRLLFHEPPP